MKKYDMKHVIGFVFLFLLIGGCSNNRHSIYQYDNGDDYVREGTIRIVDNKTHKIGFADASGRIIISPQYTFAHPFQNGKAKVTYEGHKAQVPNSDGEYHYWISNEWFYIDKTGKRL